ncbi:N-acetylmuramoyl-L-alanine amidase [Pseudonocardia halophobica]|uniref:N-acetylmuramoyl-L-alanine amidase n=1 Tax=Pseudonocardia halophobica TaxID=29401 RepID=UPI003D8E75D4
MGVRATWLVDAARLTGYPVNEGAGWRGRGHGDFRVLEGVVLHHTADGPTGIYPSLGVVRDGRAGLAGPLANLGRDGTIFVTAAGVAWHAGASRWAGSTDLNDEFLGIEAEPTGTRDDWTPQQRDCYPRLVAALLYYMRRGPDRACEKTQNKVGRRDVSEADLFKQAFSENPPAPGQPPESAPRRSKQDVQQHASGSATSGRAATPLSEPGLTR